MNRVALNPVGLAYCSWLRFEVDAAAWLIPWSRLAWFGLNPIFDGGAGVQLISEEAYHS